MRTARVLASSDWNCRMQPWIECGNNLSSPIARENQHLVYLKQAEATYQRNEHGHARHEQADDYQDTEERNFSGPVPINPGERRHCVKKSSGECSKSMRHHRTWRIGSSAELHHHKGQ